MTLKLFLKEILGGVEVFCVIGDPIEHSLSPVMHNAAFQRLKLNSVFIPFRVKKDRLGDAVAGIRGLNIRGFAVTIPHKSALIKYLDEVDPAAQAIGAVNFVDHINGRLIGYNSDGIGAVMALERSHISLEGTNVVILGAGGAAKSIAYHTAERCGKMVILNRTLSSAQSLSEKLRNSFGKEIYSRILSHDTLADSLKDADLLIHTTSIGMYPDVDRSLVGKDLLRDTMCVFDIVYNPVETQLIRDAKQAGAKTVNGVDMLVYQGVVAFEKWTGCKATVDVMKKSVLSKLL